MAYPYTPPAFPLEQTADVIDRRMMAALPDDIDKSELNVTRPAALEKRSLCWWPRVDGAPQHVLYRRCITIENAAKNESGSLLAPFSKNGREQEGTAGYMAKADKGEKSPEIACRQQKAPVIGAFFTSAKRDSNSRPSPWQGDCHNPTKD